MTSTFSDAIDDLGRLRRGRAGRRVAAVILWVFVIAAAVGLFGVRSAGVSTTNAKLTAQARFPRISRPGLPANWSIDIRRPGGFTDDVTVTTNAAYLAVFDQNDLSPQPDDTAIRNDQITWTFKQPTGEEFQLNLDGNIDTDAHLGRHPATTTIKSGSETVTLHYTTWTAP